MNEAIKMQLSAFVDGELPESEKELLLRRLSQDASLRQQVAEYLAMGRAMRGEIQIAGVDRIRARVASELDETPHQDEEVEAPADGRRMIRPLAGVAIAASVALVAILGLQQMDIVGEAPPVAPAAVVDAAAFPTQPQANDILEQYRLLHEAHGANNIRARLTSVELRQENAAESADESRPDDEAAAEETAGDTAE